jgi:hypothetical protein
VGELEEKKCVNVNTKKKGEDRGYERRKKE